MQKAPEAGRLQGKAVRYPAGLAAENRLCYAQLYTHLLLFTTPPPLSTKQASYSSAASGSPPAWCRAPRRGPLLAAPKPPAATPAKHHIKEMNETGQKTSLGYEGTSPNPRRMRANAASPARCPAPRMRTTPGPVRGHRARGGGGDRLGTCHREEPSNRTGVEAARESSSLPFYPPAPLRAEPTLPLTSRVAARPQPSSEGAAILTWAGSKP